MVEVTVAYILLAVLLFVQSIFGVLTIRARASDNLVYHAVSGTLLNVIVFWQSWLSLGALLPTVTSGQWWDAVPIGMLTVGSIMSGALVGHLLALKGLEGFLKAKVE